MTPPRHISVKFKFKNIESSVTDLPEYQHTMSENLYKYDLLTIANHKKQLGCYFETKITFVVYKTTLLLNSARASSWVEESLNINCLAC